LIENKTEWLPFDTTEESEAEMQAVLNTFTEHVFQDVFKKMADMLGMMHTSRRGLLRSSKQLYCSCSSTYHLYGGNEARGNVTSCKSRLMLQLFL
jgi:hypothetical protein